MKVALISSYGSPWARALALRLAKSDCEIHFLGFEDSRFGDSYLKVATIEQNDPICLLQNGGVKTHLIRPYGFSHLRYVFGAFSVNRICRREGIDIALPLYAGGFGLMAYLSMFRPYAVYTAGSDIYFTGGLSRLLTKRVLLGAKLIFSNGHNLMVKTKELASGKSVRNLLLGVDTAFFAPAWRTSGDAVRIICPRGFAPIYNNMLILKALARLDSEVSKKIEVVFTAPGPELNQAIEYAQMNFNSNLLARTSFLSGVSVEVMRDELRKADIIISVSLSDGSSISVQEGLACGLFPILSDIPANREWVAPGSANGMLVGVDDIGGLIDAISMAVKSTDLRLKASKINVEKISELADGIKNTKNLLADLARVVRR